MTQPSTTVSQTSDLDLQLQPGEQAGSERPLALALGSLRTAPPVRISRWQWGRMVLASDIVTLALSFVAGAVARSALGAARGSVYENMVRELPYLPVFILVMAAYGLYQHDRRRVRQTSFLDVGSRAHALVFGAIASLGLSQLAHRWFGAPTLGWLELLVVGLTALVLVPLGRAATSVIMQNLGVSRSRVLIVGSGSVATSLVQRLQNYGDIELVGFVDDQPYPSGGVPGQTLLGTIVDLPRICAEMAVDRVLVAFSQTPPTWVVAILRELPSDVRISVVPRLFELVTWQSKIEELHGLTVMDVAPPRLGMFSRATKRALDVTVSAALLLLLSPVMVVVAAAIKATSPGPVFFRQPRAGRRGQTFKITKFRTMKVGAEAGKVGLRAHNDVDGPLFKLHNDPRVTNVGRLLRTTSLDEMPQLINVLTGKMSLVGPRPFVLEESAAIDGWAARRFDVRPGMTGLWQISGRNDLPFEELRQLDYAYVASWSLGWDLKILWHTPSSVLRGHGAY
jgi:exopolysaccharide biosynthesis polyprenyl glycosylphosphotransferase